MKLNQTLVLPDIHSPWEHKKLLRKICQLMVDVPFTGLVISGDFLDNFSIASHNKGSLGKLRSFDLSDEYRWGNDLLDNLLSAGRKTTKRHFIYGNHEDRYFRWIEDGDNAKVGKALGSPTTALRLIERGFKVKESWKDDSVRLGSSLEVIHGQYCGLNPVRKHLDVYDGSVMFGHTHAYSCHVRGKRGGYNIGYLGDPSSRGFHYEPLANRKKWTNAFAVVTVLDDGSFLPHPIQCWRGRFLFSGKLY